MDEHRGLCVNRRQVLKSAGAVAGALVLRSSQTTAASGEPSAAAKPGLCLFSKPLGNRRVAELAGALNELGCDAVDLTCREPGGHVLPQRVTEDLPKAQEVLRAAGISIAMITTGITQVGKDHAEATIRTAAGLGIGYLKLGYYPYGDLARIQARLAEVKAQVRDLAALCKQYGIRAGMHNHSGPTVGAAMWDCWQIIADLDPQAVGSYFDLRHATVEGGDAGWEIGLNLLGQRVTMVAVKDFLWRKDAHKDWLPQNVPLGQGMVKLAPALRRLKELHFAGPISLHMEYGPLDQPPGSPEDRANLASIRKDWAFARDLLKQTGLARKSFRWPYQA